MSDTATPAGDRWGERASPRPWVLASFGVVALGLADRATRQAVYADALGDLRAHQVSTVALPFRAGVFLAGMTVAYELVFGCTCDRIR